MTDRTRNIIVGLTILVALCVCMYGIVLLGKFPGVGVHQYTVGLETEDAAGLIQGARVELNGISVGQVKSAYLTKDKTGKLIARVDVLIERRFDIPTETIVTLQRSATGVGQPFVELKIKDPNAPLLPKDGTAVLKATPTDSSLIPKALTDDLSALSHQLSAVANDLHVLLAYSPPETVDKADPNDPNRPLANASTVVIRLDRTVKSLQDLLADPKLQAGVRDAVQNIADASAQLKSVLSKVETLANNANGTLSNADGAIKSFGGAATQATATLESTRRNINQVSQQVVETLAQIEKTVKQVNEGNGTTGKLINDPRLYEGLLDLSKSLKTTVDKMDLLLDKWTDEGVNLHLK